jgi:hypothetical protein
MWWVSGVAGEEDRLGARIEQIHARLAPPAIDGVAAPDVLRTCHPDLDAADMPGFPSAQRFGVSVTSRTEPARDRWWSKERDRPRQGVEGRERQMVGVRVREKNRIERRQGA